ncbi:MAG: PilN domain-containing protein [Rhizomicrobium sp.]|jgi:general secretion pathway protein L
MNIKDIFNSDMETVGQWIRHGLAWWADELLALVPPEWRARLTQRPRLIVDWDERGPICREGNTSKPFDAAAYTSRELDNATIALPKTRVLTRELDLPLLPPNDIRRLVALDIDRLTPFPAEAVYFDTEILQRDADRGKQRVLLGIMPRGAIADVLDRARSAGLGAAAVGMRGDAGSNIYFDFLAQARGAGGMSGARARLPLWWGAIGILLAANIAVFAFRDSAALDSLRSDVDSQQATVAMAMHLREKVETEAARRSALLERLAHNAPLRILDAVTKILPANTWAQRVEWNGQTVQVSGYRQGPVDLLVKFEASPVLRNARALSTNAKPAAPNTPEAFEIAADARPTVKR